MANLFERCFIKRYQNDFRHSCMRRFSVKKFCIAVVLIIVSTITWNILSKQYVVNYTQTCNQLGNYQEELHEFTDRVHKILETLDFTHFLCYGSLWGQIRLSRVLPWEDKTVMCLLNEDFANKDFVMIVRWFKKEGFRISYEMTQGQYVVTKTRGDRKMKVVLILFELDKVIKMYRRIGWYRRLLPSSCEAFETLDCFPPTLVVPPLPKKEFGRSLIPVPREGIDLQKYHYKNDWWKEIPIKNC